jgi:hypothetical protein
MLYSALYWVNADADGLRIRSIIIFAPKEVSVADIISLNDKLDLAKDKKSALVKKRKIWAVQKVFQCTHCSYKCEKCGVQISHNSSGNPRKTDNLKVPYHFCEACSAEYLDFIDYLKGIRDPECYWQNHQWAEAWQKWIDYQSSVDRYVKSKEFNMLLHEFRHNRPEE